MLQGLRVSISRLNPRSLGSKFAQQAQTRFVGTFIIFLFVVGYRGIVHPPSADESAGTLASRGAALSFKACPLLSGISSLLQTPEADLLLLKELKLSGSHVTMMSVYAPIERQERAPFFQ